MLISRRLSFGKYFWLELSFLFFLTFGISIISDLEYSSREQHNIFNFTHGFTFRVVSSLLVLIPYGTYYWFFLKRYFRMTGAIIAISSILLYYFGSPAFTKAYYFGMALPIATSFVKPCLKSVVGYFIAFGARTGITIRKDR